MDEPPRWDQRLADRRRSAHMRPMVWFCPNIGQGARIDGGPERGRFKVEIKERSGR